MFKVQLIKISDKTIKDKNNNQEMKFVVLKLLEIDRETNVPTGETKDKYLKDDSKLLTKVDFKFAEYYEVDLNFSRKLSTLKSYKIIRNAGI